MQYILLIDTATDRGSVAISGDGALMAHCTNIETRNHAGTINNMINDALADAGITMAQITAIAACAGPGSYTGLRIGVATAKGLCYALDKPLMLHNRLTLLAYHPLIQQIQASQYISLLYARDKEYFISVYDNEFTCTTLPQHITEVQLGEIFEKKENSFIITDLEENVANLLDMGDLQVENDAQINLSSWAKYALLSYKCNNMINLTTAEPFYLKQVYTHN